MPKSKLTQIKLFVKSAHFFRAVVIALSLAIPLLVFNILGYISILPAFIFGVFLNASSDVPGSLRRKIIGLLLSIFITITVTVLTLYTQPFYILSLVFIALTTFGLSFLSVYGFRGSLVSFSGILAMILALVVDVSNSYEIWKYALLMFFGGLWYLGISIISHKVIPKKDDDQLLSETLQLTGEYLAIRAQLLVTENNRDPLIKKT